MTGRFLLYCTTNAESVSNVCKIQDGKICEKCPIVSLLLPEIE